MFSFTLQDGKNHLEKIELLFIELHVLDFYAFPPKFNKVFYFKIGLYL